MYEMGRTKYKWKVMTQTVILELIRLDRIKAYMSVPLCIHEIQVWGGFSPCPDIV